MRIFRWLLGGVALGALAGACGGSAEQGPTGDLESGSAQAGSGNTDDAEGGSASGGNASPGGSPGSVHLVPTYGDCGAYTGVIGYYCHTLEDGCVDDADCTHPDNGPGYCMYRPELARWVCGYGQCVG